VSQYTSRRRPRITNFWLGILASTNSAAALLALGAGPAARAFRTVTTTATIVITDDILLCNDTGAAGFTVTLPAREEGLVFVIKKIDANVSVITIATPDAATVDGSATNVISLVAQNHIVTVACDGTDWHVLS